MILRRTLPTVFAGLFALAGLGAGPCTAATQSVNRSGPTPPRLRFIDGAVSFWRTGAADWSTAQVNTALAAGDSLYAGDAANLEIQIGPQAFISAGAATEVDLTSLGSDYMQFRITGGHAAFDLKKVSRGQTIEVDTPNAALTLNRPGYYRIDVDESETAFSARRGGTATVVPAVGETTNVADNQQIILDGTDTVQVALNAAPAPDAWDRWNDDRTAQLAEAPRSAQYVPAEQAIPQPPGPQQAASQERAVAPPLPHVPARQAEQAIPQPPSHPQAPPQERAVQQQPGPQQAPQERMGQQPRPQHAPPQEDAAPQQPSAVDGRAVHEEPKQER